MDDLIIRPMRARDVVKFSRFCVPEFIGYVAERDGEIKGAVCIVWGKGNRAFLCLELSDEIRRRPIFMAKWGRAMIKAGLQASGGLYVVESAKEPTAPKWLERLGFVPTGETMNGERVLRHADSRVR